MKKSITAIMAIVVVASLVLSGCGPVRPTEEPLLTVLPSPTPFPVLTGDPDAVIVPEPDDRPNIAVWDINSESILTLKEEPYYGFRSLGHASIARDGTRLPYEVYYGIDLLCGGDYGNKVLLTWHDYTDEQPAPGAITVRDIYRQYVYELGSLDKASGEPYVIDVSSLASGPFAVDVAWSNDTNTVAYFWVNGDTVYACQTSSYPADDICEWYDRKDDITDKAAAAGVTPENCLEWGNAVFAYPCISTYNQSEYRCDNQLWTDLAQELVPDLSLPAAQKAIIIHDWMIDNLAYDFYKAYDLDESRAKYYDDWSGKYSVWDTHTGVCSDFATIYCMMLRSVGVPSTSLVQDGVHIWNLVWLNGEWVEIDVTNDMYRHVNGEDVNDIQYKGSFFAPHFPYEYFGQLFDSNRLNEDIYSVGGDMYTVDFAMGEED